MVGIDEGRANFTYHAPPVISSTFPFSGPVADSTAIVIRGANLALGTDPTCRLVQGGTTQDRPSQRLPASAVAPAPASASGDQGPGSEDDYGDAGSGSGGDDEGSGDYGSGSGDEGSGDAGSGAGFPPSPPPSPSPSFWGGKYSAGCDCPTVVPATLTDGGTTLTCVSPMTVAGSPALEVSLNAQDYSNSSAPFGVLSPVAVSAVAPPQGSGALT